MPSLLQVADTPLNSHGRVGLQKRKPSQVVMGGAEPDPLPNELLVKGLADRDYLGLWRSSDSISRSTY